MSFVQWPSLSNEIMCVSIGKRREEDGHSSHWSQWRDVE